MLLDDLRRRITDRQRAILDEIWAHMKMKNVGMPERPLFEKFTRQVLEEEAAKLGGSIIFSNHEENKRRYKLALVGMFLTSDGPRLETLMKRYLVMLKDQYDADKEIERYASKDFEKWGTQYSAEELQELRVILYASHRSFASRIGGWNAEEWFGVVDDDVVNLKRVSNWEEFVQSEIMKQYDAKEPAAEAQRMSYHNILGAGGILQRQMPPMNIRERRNSRELKLEFVDDEKLRVILESDLREVTQLLEGRAWKSCIILCGSILEGLLLWKLEDAHRDGAESPSEEGAKIADYEDFGLALLLRSCREQQLVENEAMMLTEWAREYRNLIHPGNQRRSGRQVREEHANIAINLVMLVANSMRSITGGRLE